MAGDRPFLILVVIDGFGCRKDSEWNAIAQAQKPVFSALRENAVWTTLEASGLRVGLPAGQMGNSEVGHLNIGAGRVVDQDIVRISKAIDDGSIRQNETLVKAFAAAKASGKAVHLVGLLSDGGVHSHQDHLHGLVDAAIAAGVPHVYVHAILDGRDTPPRSAITYLTRLLDHLRGKPQAQLATIVGRYYTMDRDKRWERTRRGYDLMTLGLGAETRDPLQSIQRSYEAGVDDEFVEPIAVLSPDGAQQGKIEDGDTVIFFNFRADRMRQIVTAFRDDDFSGFERSVRPKVNLVSMTRYREDFEFPVIFAPVEVRHYLGQVLAEQGIKQLRIAETEKYAHVTFFFNGGSDQVSPGEDRVLVPSPKVATYDKKPDMSVVELTDRVVEAIAGGEYGVIVLNIANPDMVGHTGVMDATVTAVEATDHAIGRIVEATRKVGGVVMITADHGNAELMFDPATGQPHTAHTTLPVPLIVAGDRHGVKALRSGGALENVAPTLLDILGITPPKEMTAQSLVER